jgi:hypothetical protein
MGNENFRRDLKRALEAMSGPPSPALSARLRSALDQRAPARPAPFWIAGLAAGLIAAIVIGVFVVSNFNRRLTSVVPGAVSTASPTAGSTPSPGETPTPGSSPSPFVCTSSAMVIDYAQAPTTALIDAVRTGTHAGYDRITIEVGSGQLTNITVEPQSNATFTQGASGQTIVLRGTAGLLVTIHGADEHTAYTGATDFKTNYPVLLESRQVQDFEGTVQWGLGLSKSACYRTYVLGTPQRLVIDIPT